MKFLRFLAPSAIVVLAYLIATGVSRVTSREPALAPPPRSLAAESLARQGVEGTVLPQPELEPDEVVDLQLAGLANREHPATGVLQCYCFASPDNIQATGPLENFGRMVRTPPYDALARARARLVGKPQVNGRTARVLASVVTDAGELHCFVFWLARQTSPEFRDCWMTDAVLPADGPSLPRVPQLDQQI